MVLLATPNLPESMEAFAAMLSKSAYAAQAFDGHPGTRRNVNQDPGTPFRLFEILPTTSGSRLKGDNCHEEQGPQPKDMGLRRTS